MSTYYQLQQKIVDDLKGRSDLAQVIRDEIKERVQYYQNEGFASQEAIDTSITTVAGTSTYNLPSTCEYVTQAWFLYFTVWTLLYPKDIEWINTYDSIVPPIQSPPSFYSIYGKQIRLYTTPDNAYNLKLAMIKDISVPVLDTDTNFWTEDAFSLIRHATVAVIRRSYLGISDEADQADTLARRELKRLLSESIKQSGTGFIVRHWY